MTSTSIVYSRCVGRYEEQRSRLKRSALQRVIYLIGLLLLLLLLLFCFCSCNKKTPYKQTEGQPRNAEEWKWDASVKSALATLNVSVNT